MLLVGDHKVVPIHLITKGFCELHSEVRAEVVLVHSRSLEDSREGSRLLPWPRVEQLSPMLSLDWDLEGWSWMEHLTTLQERFSDESMHKVSLGTSFSPRNPFVSTSPYTPLFLHYPLHLRGKPPKPFKTWKLTVSTSVRVIFWIVFSPLYWKCSGKSNLLQQSKTSFRISYHSPGVHIKTNPRKILTFS